MNPVEPMHKKQTTIQGTQLVSEVTCICSKMNRTPLTSETANALSDSLFGETATDSSSTRDWCAAFVSLSRIGAPSFRIRLAA